MPGLGLGLSPVLGARGGASAGNGLLTGLLAYWAMDEVAGNDRACVDNARYDLTEYAADVGRATGKVHAYAASFVGGIAGEVGECLRVVSGGDKLPANANDWTLAAWVRATSWATTPTPWQPGFYRTILSDENPGAGRLLLTNYGKQMYLGYFVAPGVSFGIHTAPAFDDSWLNVWHLIIGWYDAAAKTLYLSIDNGTPYSDTRDPAWIGWPAELLTVGNYGNTAAAYSWDGQIGPLVAWGRVLTEDQRAALWNDGAGLAYSAFTE